MTDPDRTQRSRRGFFREALSSFLDSLEEIVEGQAPPWQDMESRAQSSAGSRKVELRPPGAKPEAEFLQLCQKSHACISACPVGAIQARQSTDSRDDRTPVVIASEKACVVCDDLSCMKACPSGALELVPKEQIQMGWAVVETATCLRTAGEDCTICVERCPLGSSALDLDPSGQVAVHEGCVGCGVCEYYCPTNPRAIRIMPR